MQVGESTLKQLIEGEKQFQVPLYQRQYAWETPQLSQLWDDVIEQYDILTPDDSGSLNGQAPTHFLGSMVLAPSPLMQAQGVTPFLVIDGQQRLTTLLIALCALRDHVVVEEPAAIDRFNDRYLINKYGAGLSRFRLLPTQTDREEFFACVERHDPAARSGGIGVAYSSFRSRLTRRGPDNEPLDLSRIETVISQRLQFVAITADVNDNVHRIFESLNDRGVRLTQADLLRNYIFMLLPTRAEQVYQSVWLPMQKLLTTGQLETLVFVDLIVRGQSSVKRQDIYRAQQTRLRSIEADEAAVEAEVKELARKAKLFRRIVQPSAEEDADVRSALMRLDRWGASTIYPLLMHMLDLREQGSCTSLEVTEALSYIESFLVRRMIAGVPTNNLNRIFSAIIPQMPPNLPLPSAVRHALSETRKYWPSDHRLREAIRTNPFYFQGRQDQKMLVFQRLEEGYQHAELIDWVTTKLSIEHIMPQSLSDEWNKDLAASGDDPTDVHSELLHTLGNLTVTAYNGQLSNNPFERKKQILQNSHLELNKAISPADHWARAEILSRANDLADEAVEIWPSPMPGIEPPAAGRDWTRLHAALAALPYGAWTTYSDAAELIGSHQVPIGQHLASIPGILNAHRVLTADGCVSPGFGWTDTADTRDIHDVLRSEGVKFDNELRAVPSQRLKSDDLADLVGEADEAATAAPDRQHNWQLHRLLRYLRHFYEASDGRLHQGDARELAVREGYDPRGVAGFYQGTASLRIEGEYRALTDAGRQFYEENRYRLDEIGA
jgi:alkylated DNA nucleotide flippase Atl1